LTTETTSTPDEGNQTRSDTGGLNLNSIVGHLNELSNRLKNSLIAYIVALAVLSSIPNPFHPFGGPHSFFGYNFLLTTLIRRAEAAYTPNITFIAISPADPIFAFLNLAMILALLVSLPYIFFQVYGFVAPGLYAREKRVVRKYVLPFTVLLTIGGIFGLFVVFPIVMRILLLFFRPLNVASFLTLDSFVNYLVWIPLMTGLAFTFPVFVIPLVELRILKAEQLAKARKWFYVGFALAVSIANPDPTDISSIPIIVPILVLYEITVFVAKRIEKNRTARAVAQGLAVP
jgi:sec-independent protein translocase protein TatC